MGRPMRGRTLSWTIVGSLVAAVAVAVALILADSGTSPKGAASTGPSGSAGARTHARESAPVVTPPPSSGTSSFSYLSDLNPSGDFAGSVVPGPATISGSIYPKSISFYCNVGDPTAFPVYALEQNARRFQATIGLAPNQPAAFRAGILLVGDGRTLGTFNVSDPKPKTVDVDVHGVHALQLECFGSGNSSTGGEAVDVAWGNARVAGRR